MFINIYIYIYMYIDMCIYIYIHMQSLQGIDEAFDAPAA